MLYYNPETKQFSTIKSSNRMIPVISEKITFNLISKNTKWNTTTKYLVKAIINDWNYDQFINDIIKLLNSRMNTFYKKSIEFGLGKYGSLNTMNKLIQNQIIPDEPLVDPAQFKAWTALLEHNLWGDREKPRQKLLKNLIGYPQVLNDHTFLDYVYQDGIYKQLIDNNLLNTDSIAYLIGKFNVDDLHDLNEFSKNAKIIFSNDYLYNKLLDQFDGQTLSYNDTGYTEFVKQVNARTENK